MSIILYIMQFSFGWQDGVDYSELPGTVQATHKVQGIFSTQCIQVKQKHSKTPIANTMVPRGSVPKHCKLNFHRPALAQPCMCKIIQRTDLDHLMAHDGDMMRLIIVHVWKAQSFLLC